jgi:hypothetical protein
MWRAIARDCPQLQREPTITRLSTWLRSRQDLRAGFDRRTLVTQSFEKGMSLARNPEYPMPDVSKPAVQPLFNPADDEWVVMTGRYILNMGVIEFATRLLIVRIEGTDAVPIFSVELAARIGFIRKRFPRANAARHKWAMDNLEVAMKHTTFRNIVAHSPLVLTNLPDGSFHIGGIANVTPKSLDTLFEMVSLDELKGRVNESAVVGRHILEMQADFS